MNVSQRLFIDSVEYGGNGLIIKVIPQVVDERGAIVGASGMELVTVPESDAIARGAANGRSDGEWGNTEVGQIVLAEQILDRPANPGLPAITEIRDQQGNIIRAARAEVPAVAATYKPRFGDVTTIAWPEPAA